jgi:hypothetical protein
MGRSGRDESGSSTWAATMRITCCLGAAPYPVSTAFTWAGVYSWTTTPAPPSVARIAPRAWATAIPLVAFLPMKSSSRAASRTG